MARFKPRRRWPKAVARLADTMRDIEPPTPAGGRAPWHVVMMTDPDAKRIYTVMTQNIAFALHRATTPLLNGYAQSAGVARLVLTETYPCRHTAYARMMRIRGWPVAERRKLIEETNPGWADLAANLAA